MPNLVTSRVHLFADDTKLYKHMRVTTIEDHQALQADLTSLKDWTEKWKLCFNIDKVMDVNLGSRYG